MKNNKKGKIDISELNIPPEKHEYETAKYFADRGHDVRFIAPNYSGGVYNPDFMMLGKTWETKSPITYGAASFEHVLRKAMKQSGNIIYDLRRLERKYEDKYIRELRRNSRRCGIKVLLVITKDGRLLTIKGIFDNIIV